MYLQVVPSTRQRQLNRPGSTTPPAGLLSSMPPPSGCTALVSRLLLHLHCIDTAPSLQPHSTLTTPLVHFCCTFTAHCTLTANSLHPQCAGTPTSLLHAPTLHSHDIATASSPHPHCIALSLRCHCTLTVLCCCATGFVMSDDTPASLSRPATPTSMGHTGSVGGAKSPEDINSDRLHLILGTRLVHIHAIEQSCV